ncbi:hypothetical protein GCM10010329_81200 [Streptomyces spiroverticillatus]|uniref:Secreted protein/lipoprotein n=1 Tax=Streptomyces finlayi TaxID=67296 RepID=A0A918X7A6_9ACTN|nr:hypothetical protein [Streptomyces finlayi]GHA46399.1 hypothetical protein GCM10010329_81200 [Streptomyces spiroverticillatus]GHD16312.1 hypothetical protein GCM10010334_77300 [Streptomyces finlayi]
MAGTTARRLSQEDRKRRRSPLGICAAAAVALIAPLTSCSTADKPGDANPPPASTAPAAPAPTATRSADETAKAEALAAYAAYWREMQVLYAEPTSKKANLKNFAASQALLRAESDAKRLHGLGLHIVGEAIPRNSTVTSADLSRRVPNVLISSCLDIRKWQTVSTTTQKPASLPPERLTQYVINARAERWPEGWRIVRDEPQDQRC